MLGLPTGHAMFAVESAVLWPAVADALDGVGPTEGNLSVHAQALAAYVGMAQPDFIGRRWDRLDWWVEGGEEDEEDTSEVFVAPVRRLLYRISPHVRFLASFPQWAAEGLLVSLGVPIPTAEAFVIGDTLSRRLDPPRAPSPEDDFPSELCIVDASRATEFHQAIREAIDRYRHASGERAAKVAGVVGVGPGSQADRFVFPALAALLSATELLVAGGTELLVSTVI